MSSLSRHFEGRPRRRLHATLDHSSKGRQKILVNVFDMVTAIRNTRLRKGVTELLGVCHRSAREGGTRKCFGCLQRWTLAYAPAGVVLIEFVGDPRRSATDALFAGVCAECFGDGERIMQSLERDFPGRDWTPIVQPGRA